MDKTVNWLPTRSEDNRGTLYVLAGDHPETGLVDGNVMTASQVARANAKYWDVYCWNWAIDDWEPYTGGSSVLCGDVNTDGAVNISDVTTLIDYLLSGDASAVNLSAADCNNDSSVNIADVTSLIDYLLGNTWSSKAVLKAGSKTPAGDLIMAPEPKVEPEFKLLKN